MRIGAPVGRSIGVVVLLATTCVLAVPAQARAAGGPPIIAYSGTADELDQVWTARLDGTIAQRFTHPVEYGEPWTSIGGGLVAVTKHRTDSFFASRVHVYDARTGEERYVIGDARYPLIVWNGTGVASFFWFSSLKLIASLCTATRSSFFSKMVLTML